MNDAVTNHVLTVALVVAQLGRASRLIMEVRRSAAIGKPMVDIGIGIIRGPEIELVSITSASCR